MAYDSEYTPVVRALECLRGISTLDAFGLAVEIGDWNRFTGPPSAPTWAWYLPRIPPAQRRSQGGITKTGNTHARRLLIEAAWHHRRPYTHPVNVMRSRWEAATPEARTRGHAGNGACTIAGIVYLERRKRPVVANVAIARELAGWCWSLASEAQTAAANPRPGKTPGCLALVSRSAWSKPASTMGSPQRPRPTLDQRYAPAEHLRPAVTNPRILV